MASINNKVNNTTEISEEITSFIGGMNTNATDDKVLNNEVRLVQNMDIDNYGTVEKRTGLVYDYEKSFSIEDNPHLQGVFDFVETIDNKQVDVKIVVAGGKFYRNGEILFPYLYDELEQKYREKPETGAPQPAYYVDGFNNGSDESKSIFQVDDYRPVTATYSKGVLLIATGWKLMEYGLFPDKEMTSEPMLHKVKEGDSVSNKTIRVLFNAPESIIYGSNFYIQIIYTDQDTEVRIYVGGVMVQQENFTSDFFDFSMPSNAGTANSDFPDEILRVEEIDATNTKSYYLRSVKPKYPSDTEAGILGENLSSMFYNIEDKENKDIISPSSSGTPNIIDFKYSIELLEYIGEPTDDYYKYVPALVVEPVLSIGELYKTETIASGTQAPVVNTNSCFVYNSDNTSRELINSFGYFADVSGYSDYDGELNNYNISSPNKFSDNEIAVPPITELINKKWYFANHIKVNRYCLSYVNTISVPSSATSISGGRSFEINQGNGAVTITSTTSISTSTNSIMFPTVLYSTETLGGTQYLNRYIFRQAAVGGKLSYTYDRYQIISTKCFADTDYEKYQTIGDKNNAGTKFRSFIPCINRFEVFFDVLKSYIRYNNGNNELERTSSSSVVINFKEKLDSLIANIGRNTIDGCNLIINYNNGTFLSGDIKNTNTYYQGYLDNYNYFPSRYVDAILGTYTTTITKMLAYRNGFLVFSDREIYYRTNLNPEERNLRLLNNTVGCISNFGAVNIGNDCVFLSYDGFYRLYLTYGTATDNFNVKKLDKNIDNLIAPYLEDRFSAYKTTQPFLLRIKDSIYAALRKQNEQEEGSVIFKYNEVNESWSVDSIDNSCGTIKFMSDKYGYIEYYTTLGSTKMFIQYNKDTVDILEARVNKENKVFNKNIFYSDNSKFSILNLEDIAKNEVGVAYTSVLETNNNYYNNYKNWFKKFYRWYISTHQDKNNFTKLMLTVYVDDFSILKPINFTANYDDRTNAVIYNEENKESSRFVWSDEKGMFVEELAEEANEAIITLRNNVIAMPTDNEQITIKGSDEDSLGVKPIEIINNGDSHYTDVVRNYGGAFNISAYETPNIDKYVANIKGQGLSTRIRIEQVDETQYFAITSVGYIFKFDTDFKRR